MESMLPENIRLMLNDVSSVRNSLSSLTEDTKTDRERMQFNLPIESEEISNSESSYNFMDSTQMYRLINMAGVLITSVPVLGLMLIALYLSAVYDETKYYVSPQNLELMAGGLEGDIIDDGSSEKSKKWKVWPENRVSYWIHRGGMREEQFLKINRAVDKLQTALDNCISFVESRDHHHVLISTGIGCASTIGYQTYGPKKFMGGRMKLDPDCTEGMVMHQFLHVLGIQHTHSRSDRDKYIKIDKEAIFPAFRKNFAKRKKLEVYETKGTYDYGSIMHFSGKAYSRNSSTIEALHKIDGVIIGQRSHLSKQDISNVRKLYNCVELTPTH